LDELERSTSDESRRPTRVEQVFEKSKLPDDPGRFRISVPVDREH
jgi:hypothetical protein